MAKFSYGKRCLAEFIGSYLLVFTVGCNVLNGNAIFGALSVACVLMVGIYAFGAVSGANFNPAVSVALGMAGKMERGWGQVAAYIVAQTLGALTAGLSFRGVFRRGVEVGPHQGAGAVGALICELVYTFLMCFVFLNVCSSKAKGGKNQYFGLAVGFVIIAGAYGSGPVGAGCFNPAVVFGLVCSTLFQVGWQWFGLFTLLEIAGAMLAVLLFRFARPDDEDDDDVLEEPEPVIEVPQPVEEVGMPSKLHVSIISATGLKHLNMIGDKMYVTCQVLDAISDQPKREQGKKMKCETKIIAKTLDPVWDETFTVDWAVGDSIEFIVCDQGLLGSRTEGTVAMWSDNFYPRGFKGALPISGLDHATLNVHIIPHVPPVPTPRKPEPPPKVDKCIKLETKLISEFIGTYILVFTVGLNVLGGSKAGAFSIAAAYMVVIYAVGDISGGYFNPAVTLAVWLADRSKHSFAEVCFYWMVQLFAGIAGAFTYALAHDGTTFPLGPGIGHGWGELVFVEAVFTFVLTFVILCICCVDQPPAKEYTGFIIGSCVTAGAGASGTISGGALNPAVAVGVATSHIIGGGLFYKCFIYAFFEFLGALIACGVFKVVYAGQMRKEDHEDQPMLSGQESRRHDV